ncbi:MAG: hypothetical protein ABUL62_02055 [Myxococcales bacterium]
MFIPRSSITALTQIAACTGLICAFPTPALAQDADPPAATPEASAPALAPPAPLAAPSTDPVATAPAASPEVAPAPDVTSAPPAAAKPKPPPYSLPWQLRPVAPGNVVRLDSSYAFYKNPGKPDHGHAFVSTLLGSYKILPDLAVIGRLGFVYNSPPDAIPDVPRKTNFLNPVLGGLYGIELAPSLKLGLFLGVALPLGSGGTTNSLPSKRTATSVGISTRSAFDNAMFAVDYFTVFPGVDLAFVKAGFTLQGEATIFKLTRVRGTSDDSRVNLTMGVHAGYFITPFLSVGAELRHQRWLSTPATIKGKDALRDTATFAVGPRFHFKFTDSMWFRPGVSLTVPLDDPMKKSDYTIVQLDLPLSF